MRRANPNGGRAPGLRALTVDQGTTELHSLNRGPFLIWQCCFSAAFDLLESASWTARSQPKRKRSRTNG